MLLEGIFAAVTTCFYPDGRPYCESSKHNVDRYSRTALSGMVLLGSTGEAVMLTMRNRGSSACGTERLDCGQGSGCGGGRESVVETLRLAEFERSSRTT